MFSDAMLSLYIPDDQQKSYGKLFKSWVSSDREKNIQSIQAKWWRSAQADCKCTDKSWRSGKLKNLQHEIFAPNSIFLNCKIVTWVNVRHLNAAIYVHVCIRSRRPQICFWNFYNDLRVFFSVTCLLILYSDDTAAPDRIKQPYPIRENKIKNGFSNDL